jgi:FtsZ-interacting cell division protein YlmF
MSGLWDRTLVYLGLREEREDAYDDVYDDRGDAPVARFDADDDPHAERAPRRPAERRRAAAVDPVADAEPTPPTPRGRSRRPAAPDRGDGPATDPDPGTRPPASAARRPSERSDGGADRVSGAPTTGSSRTSSAATEPVRAPSDTPARREVARSSPQDSPAAPAPSRPIRRDPERPDGSNVTRLPRSDVHVLPVPRGASVQVEIVTVIAFDEVEAVGQRVRAGEPVLFDLRDADATTSRRVVDFVSGLVFGLHGRLERVASRAFLVRPRGVELSAAERERLGARGYRVPAGSEA